MLALERHQAIVGLVDAEGSARVSELARRFSVTDETIRRDLQKLDQQGRLLRSHGGAVSLSQQAREAPYWHREVTQVPEKRAIAEAAIARVREGQRILLDGSSSAWYVAQALPDLSLTVVTNSIQVAQVLVSRPRMQVIATGGALSRSSLSFLGPTAEQTLSDYYVDLLFFSCGGVDPAGDITDVTAENAALRRRMIACAERSILLADHTKFGIRALAAAAPVTRISEVITDAGTPAEVVKALEEIGIDVTVVSPASG